MAPTSRARCRHPTTSWCAWGRARRAASICGASGSPWRSRATSAMCRCASASLSEDLVTFATSAAPWGCSKLNCAHRGTSLEYGLISERGIRCCYHGWVYDVDGRISRRRASPASSTLERPALPGRVSVYEYCGLIFAYMGPPEKTPAFPLYDTFDLPGFTLMPAGKFALPCNWLSDQGQQHGPGAHVISPRDLERLSVHGGLRRAGRAGLGGERRTG